MSLQESRTLFKRSLILAAAVVAALAAHPAVGSAQPDEDLDELIDDAADALPAPNSGR